MSSPDALDMAFGVLLLVGVIGFLSLYLWAVNRRGR